MHLKISQLLFALIIIITPCSAAEKIHLPEASEFKWEESFSPLGFKTEWEAVVTKDNVTWKGCLNTNRNYRDPQKIKLMLCEDSLAIIPYGKKAGLMDKFDPNQDETIFFATFRMVDEDDYLDTLLRIDAQGL